MVLTTILIFENRKMEKEGIIPRKGEEREDEPVQYGVAGEEAKVPRYRYIW